MLQWFVVKINYQKGNEDGKIQKMTEEYLFDALTYGEVEQRVHEELAENMRFEFNLANIAKTNLHEIFYFEIDESAMQAHWFKCKVNFLEHAGFCEQFGRCLSKIATGFEGNWPANF